MHRKYLAPRSGMLFLYDRPQEITMWMHNTYIPLDMIFIGSDWRVQLVAEWAVPLSLDSINSGGPAIAVLELNAGTSALLGIRRGDKVRFDATEF